MPSVPGILAILEFAVIAVSVLFVMRANSVGDAPLEVADIDAQRIGIEYPFAAGVLTLVAGFIADNHCIGSTFAFKKKTLFGGQRCSGESFGP